jgi:hypothetical protein
MSDITAAIARLKALNNYAFLITVPDRSEREHVDLMLQAFPHLLRIAELAKQLRPVLPDRDSDECELEGWVYRAVRDLFEALSAFAEAAKETK